LIPPPPHHLSTVDHLAPSLADIVPHPLLSSCCAFF
jgi:hypothetical protein